MATPTELSRRAREMRNSPTEWEKRLRRALSQSQLGGHKFRRQAVIGNYICDFLCPAKAVIVEVDGDTHDADRDAARDEVLVKRGYRVVRVTNAEVRNNMQGVLELLLTELDGAADRWPATPPQTPPLKGRG